jgi:hypothetical protein
MENILGVVVVWKGFGKVALLVPRLYLLFQDKKVNSPKPIFVIEKMPTTVIYSIPKQKYKKIKKTDNGQAIGYLPQQDLCNGDLPSANKFIGAIFEKATFRLRS